MKTMGFLHRISTIANQKTGITVDDTSAPNGDNPLQTLLLHLDDALQLQPEFVQVARHRGAHEMDEKARGQAIRLWSAMGPLDLLHHSIASQPYAHPADARLCFMGSGDFHHVSSVLIKDAAERCAQPITIVHIDNHPGWVNFEGGIHCGSWINNALEHPLVEKVITLGVNSRDLEFPETKGGNLTLLSSGQMEIYPYAQLPSRVQGEYGSGGGYFQLGHYLNWISITDLREEAFLQLILRRIQTAAVYITLDKDAIFVGEAITNWDQGQLRLRTVLRLIHEIGSRFRIVGADVMGDYSKPVYGGPLVSRLLKRAETLIEQPKGDPDPIEIRKRNSSTNLALLEAFSEVMA